MQLEAPRAVWRWLVPGSRYEPGHKQSKSDITCENFQSGQDAAVCALVDGECSCDRSAGPGAAPRVLRPIPRRCDVQTGMFGNVVSGASLDISCDGGGFTLRRSGGRVCCSVMCITTW